jgi:hypothetical protein
MHRLFLRRVQQCLVRHSVLQRVDVSSSALVLADSLLRLKDEFTGAVL